MTTFLRLLNEVDKAQALADVCFRLRQCDKDSRSFDVAAQSFDAVPGKPFAYWVSEAVRNVFRRFSRLDSNGRAAKQGLATADDFRFVRAQWECRNSHWVNFAKGGAYSKYYADIYLSVNWSRDGVELCSFAGSVIRNPENYLHPALTWPLRTQSGLSLRAMPAGCIFAHKGPAAFVANDDPTELLALLAIVNSRAFGLLVSLQISFGSYEVGVLQKTPVPDLTDEQTLQLAALARRSWSLKRQLDTTNEVSHAFLLPATVQARAGESNPEVVGIELLEIQAEIDGLAYDLYGFGATDRQLDVSTIESIEETDPTEGDDAEEESTAPSSDTLLSWATGIAFGRFDLRLATGERDAPPEPEPFDPLPAKSPGMLPDGAAPFHAHAGILVDDPGHRHDLTRLVEDVLARVEMPVPEDLRRWLQKDFFAFHLQRYSKSRRKAPIYWPLSTASGSYTLWLYYPSLGPQTLYTAINDFVEPKLAQVAGDVAALRNKSVARSRDEEKRFEAAESLELELIELRDQLLKIAPAWHPNHDDGVQITAAPLWPLFRHKPWQKILKDTWAKLENGDYDWAHLAMSYWPERARAKCITDKSLAIAHGLEALYIEPPAKAKKTRAKKNDGA